MNKLKQSHPLDLATKLTEKSGEYHGRTAESYANVIGPFGGYIAAILLRAVIEHPKAIGEPLSLTINYAAAMADGDFKIKVKEARTSRTTQHWIMELIQEEQIVITGTAVFAIRRETWGGTDSKFPSVPPMDQFKENTAKKGSGWIHHYDVRVIEGGLENTQQETTENNSDEALTVHWIQDKPKRIMDFVSLTSMSDAFYPRIFFKRNKIVPASTVSLTIYFHVDSEVLIEHGDKEVLGVVRGMKYNGGFFDHIGEMWSPDGQLLATTTQVVYYKD